MALSSLLGLAILPELAQRFVLAQVVGTQLQDRLGAFLRPEFLGALHALVELLHGGLHITARDRQAQPAIFRVTHLLLVILQVRQRARYDLTRTRFAILLRRLA